MSRTIRFIHHNHFDPLWRRGWRRPIEHNGFVFQPYARVEEQVILRWIALARTEGCTFGEGQAVVWREFFQRHPHTQQEVRELYDRGLLDLFACGEVIADSNMPAGESYLRNLLYGLLSMREMFGEAGRSNVGWLCDAFGNAAQLPQMFRHFNIDYLFRLTYNEPDGERWRGLDGTEIRVQEPWQEVDFGTPEKHPPCAACRGRGCATCNETGLDLDRFPRTPTDLLELAPRLSDSLGVIFYQTEECLPDPAHAEGVRLLQQQGFDAAYGTYRELLQRRPCADTGRPGAKTDLNPANTGCYVTRIKTKQRVRELEYRLLSLEQLAATLAERYDVQQVRKIWQIFCFALFHDAITGTHVDDAYDELMALLDEVEQFCRSWQVRQLGDVANTTGTVTLQLYEPLPAGRPADTVRVPAGVAPGTYRVTCNNTLLTPGLPLAPGDPLGLPALGETPHATLTLEPVANAPAPLPARRFANDWLEVDFDDQWLVTVRDRADGTVLSGRHHFWRPLSLSVEPDYGDPWTTFLDTTHGLYSWHLFDHVQDCTLDRVPGGLRLSYTGAYTGHNPYITHLQFSARFYLWDNAPGLDMDLDIDWDTRNSRVRLCIPVPSPVASGHVDALKGVTRPGEYFGINGGRYEVPFGHLARGTYTGSFTKCGTNGDWPAQTWVQVAVDENHRLALFNAGTPSHRVRNGVLSCSILRSPDAPTFLDESAYYEFHAHDGKRDAGRHAFRFRLLPHDATLTPDELSRRGMAFNAPLLCGSRPREARTPLTLDLDGVVVTAIKRSEDDTAWIVRLAELRGAPAAGTLAWQLEPATAWTANGMEERGARIGPAKSLKLQFRPFEIKTLRLEPRS